MVHNTKNREYRNMVHNTKNREFRKMFYNLGGGNIEKCSITQGERIQKYSNYKRRKKSPFQGLDPPTLQG